MEELIKAMGIKPTKEMSLDEIRTRIDDYCDFDDSLQEISEVLEINTGTYMQLHSIYDDNADEIEGAYAKRWAMNYKHLCRNPQELAYILLAIFVRAHAKIGEIAFMLENSINALNDRESETIDDMMIHEMFGVKNITCPKCGSGDIISQAGYTDSPMHAYKCLSCEEEFDTDNE